MKLHNLIAFQKRKKQDLLREMIIKGTSLAKTTKQAISNSKEKKDLFKKGQTFKSQLKARIKKRRESNLKKINKVKVKTVKV